MSKITANKPLIGLLVIVLLFLGAFYFGARGGGVLQLGDSVGDETPGTDQNSVVNNSGDSSDEESAITPPNEACEALCSNLQNQLEKKLSEKANELIQGAGCNVGPAPVNSSPPAAGTMFGSAQYHCNTQSSAESLGQALEDSIDNPTARDREIDNLRKQVNENCPCDEGGSANVEQCTVCNGVPEGELCPTYFVTSAEDCAELGGTITSD